MIGETSVKDQTYSKDPSAQTHDTNNNLIRFMIVKNWRLIEIQTEISLKYSTRTLSVI